MKFVNYCKFDTFFPKFFTQDKGGIIKQMKDYLIKSILFKMNNEYSSLKDAFNAVQSYAISDELKSEGKYDTRATEAKYLADAQRARLNKLKSEIIVMENFSISSNDTISVGSIFEFEDQLYFILPISTQGNFQYEGKTIKSIFYQSKLAQEVISLEKDDSFEHPVTGKELQITKVM